MESKANYTLVGASVLTLVFALVAAVVWISQTTSGAPVSNYTIYFSHHSVSGLQEDSDVTMRGIRIGKVKSFKISPVDIERIQVVVEVMEDAPIKTDTEAVINRNVLTGLASIDLTGGTAASNFRNKILQTGEKFPVIPEGRTELDTIASSIPGLMDDFGQMVSQAKHVFSKENRENISKTLFNIEKFSTDLAKSGDDLSELVVNLNDLVGSLKVVSVDLQEMLKGSDPKWRKAIGSLHSTLSQAEEAVETVTEETELLSRSMRSGIDVLIVDINNVARDLSRAAQSVTAAMDRLDDPKALIAGPSERSLGPGEKLPR